jgi:hypothetical protein
MFGAVASVFFAKKKRIIFYSTGFAAGLTFFTNLC